MGGATGTLVTPRAAERESQPVCLEMCVFEMTGNNKRIKERKRGREREGEVVREKRGRRGGYIVVPTPTVVSDRKCPSL